MRCARACGRSPATGSPCASSTSATTAGQWWRGYGNELWEFDEHGLMRRREASINDLAITLTSAGSSAPGPADERGAEIPIQLPPRDQPVA